MSERPGFMLYHRDMRALNDMSDKNLGALVKLLYAVSMGEDPEPPNQLRILFTMMAERIREDAEAYDRKVAQAQRAGQASAEARRNRTDVNERQRTSTDVNQANRVEANTTKANTNTSRAYDRDDDMSDVLMEV